MRRLLAFPIGRLLVLSAMRLPTGAAAETPDFLYFVDKVMPLVRADCATPKCHGGAADRHPRFTALDPKADEPTLRADYQSALKFVRFGKPLESPFLLKPLYRRDGGVKHDGGDIWRRDSDEYRTVAAWINGQTAGNIAPVADPGPDRKVPVGQAVQLDGSASHDLNGDKLSFRWRLWERPPGSQAELADDRSPRPTLVPDVEGRYVVELWVSDGDLRSKPAQVKIEASSPDPSVVLLEPEQHALQSPLERRSDPEAQAGAYVTADRAVRNKGSVEIPFQIVQEGQYALWARVQADEPVTAFAVGIDQSPAIPWRVQAAATWTLQKAERGTADLLSGPTTAWRVLVGRWELVQGQYRAASDPKAATEAAAALAPVALAEGIVRVVATPQAGTKSSAYIIFDYRGQGRSRYAGLDASEPGAGRFLIGPDQPLEVREEPLEPGRPYRLALRLRKVDGNLYLAQLFVEGKLKVERLYPEPLVGEVGLMCRGGETRFDDFVVLKDDKVVFHDDFSRPAASAPTPGQAGEVISWRLTAGPHRLTVSVLQGGVKLDQLQLRRLAAPAASKTP